MGLRILVSLDSCANRPKQRDNVLTHRGSLGPRAELKPEELLTSPPSAGTSAASRAHSLGSKQCGLDFSSWPPLVRAQLCAA